MRATAIIALALMAQVLVACDIKSSTTAEPDRGSKLNRGEVTLTAVAPDGTKLWSVYVDGRYVYFSSRGTQISENCGKGCTRPRTTPAADE